MNLIKTKSFQLAILTRGDKNATKLAIVLPGRLDTKDYSNFPSHLECLANRGFLAISFDPPGTWESPGDTSLFTTTNYIKAVNELIEYYGNKPTLLLGHSRGATVSILSGSTNPVVIGFVAIMAAYGAPSAPIAEAKRIGFEVTYRDLPPGNIKTTEQKKFDLSINYFKDGELYDPVTALQTSTKPKLLFYGTNDEFTEPNRVKEVYETALEPKMLHELRSNHDYRYHPQIVEEVNQVMWKFISKFGL